MLRLQQIFLTANWTQPRVGHPDEGVCCQPQTPQWLKDRHVQVEHQKIQERPEDIERIVGLSGQIICDLPECSSETKQVTVWAIHSASMGNHCPESQCYILVACTMGTSFVIHINKTPRKKGHLMIPMKQCLLPQLKTTSADKSADHSDNANELNWQSL